MNFAESPKVYEVCRFLWSGIPFSREYMQGTVEVIFHESEEIPITCSMGKRFVFEVVLNSS